MIIESYRQLFLWLWNYVGFFGAIVGISIIVSIICLPLYAAIGKMVAKENELQEVLLPQIVSLKEKYARDAAVCQAALECLYARYQYNPFLSIRKVLPLFVALPFLFLTYYMLEGTQQLNGVSFLCFKDIGKADGLIGGVNLLPFIMTGINLLTAFATPGMTTKDRNQAIFISVFFLVLLYTANTALMIYWCLNQFFNFLRSLCIDNWSGANTLVNNLHKILKGLMSSLSALASSAHSARFWQSTAIIVTFLSFYLFVTARSLVVLSKMNSQTTYLLCQYGMLVAVMGALALSYILLWRERATCNRVVLAVCFCLLLIFAGVLVCARFVFAELFDTVKYYCDRLTIYEVLSSVLIVPYILRKRLAYAGLYSEFLATVKSEGMLLLLPLTMAIHYAFSSTNITLSAASVLMLCVYMVLPSILISMVSILAFRIWWSAKVIFRSVVGLCFGAYLIPLISTENGFLSYDSNLIIRLFLIATVTCLIVFIKSRKMLYVFLAFLFVAISGNAARVALTKTADTFEESANVSTPSEKSPSLILPSARRHNNIFYFVYDAFENLIVQKALGIDDPTFTTFLVDRGFTLYDAYSTGYHTLASMSAAFTIAGVHGMTQRSTIAGDNPFCDFLRANGYRNSFMLSGLLMPQPGEPLPGDFYYPTPSGMVPQERVLFTCVLRGILSQSPAVFNRYTLDEWGDVKHSLLAAEPRSNAFLYAHCDLPDHANYESRYRGLDEDIVREYLQRLNVARRVIREDVELALSRNDDAIIVLASDHGAYLHSPDVEDHPDSRELTDRHGVVLAIRWPEGYSPTLQLSCLQNVAPEIMICLTGDSSLSRLESEGVTDAMRSPALTSPGTIKRGIIQTGPDVGKSLFSAARDAFEMHAALNNNKQ